MPSGSCWETKRWPADRFVETINALHEGDARCVLIGGGEDKRLCRQIAADCRSTPIDLSGATSLPQFAAIIELASAVLCHDSAAMHLAVALKRPLICVTGPTHPRRTGPYRRLEDVVSLSLDGSPCYYRLLRQCPYNHRCMAELAAEPVMSALSQALEVVAPSSR